MFVMVLSRLWFGQLDNGNQLPFTAAKAVDKALLQYCPFFLVVANNPAQSGLVSRRAALPFWSYDKSSQRYFSDSLRAPVLFLFDIQSMHDKCFSFPNIEKMPIPISANSVRNLFSMRLCRWDSKKNMFLAYVYLGRGNLKIKIKNGSYFWLMA